MKLRDEDCIIRGKWRVSLERGFVAHADGWQFRIIRDPLCAICTEATGNTLSAERLALLQARAVAVFWATERLIETLNRRTTARGLDLSGGRPSG